MLSAVTTVSETFQKPDCRAGLHEATTSADSLGRRRPLTFAAFKTEVKLFIGRGHWDI